MSSLDEGHFAWGMDRVAGCDCPAVTAGLSMENYDVRSTAEMYDTHASHYDYQGGPDSGVLTNRDARQAWFDTIDLLIERIERGYDDIERLHAAARVAHNLGWTAELED